MKAGLVLALALAALAAPAAAEREGPSDPRELEAFLDGVVPALLEGYHAPGLVISVVRDGRVLLAKGYGVADVATGRPMDPEHTIVRVASISKLVTATAAMQLVAAGKLDLDADVNRYLDGFRIEERFGSPVTLAELLTHTAGFDDRFLGSGRALGAPLPTLRDYLAERMPARAMPPGRVVSYSNHGLALVGHLVERASGLSFPDYVQRNVFDPLGMDHSRFGLRVPLDPNLAVPYTWSDGRYLPLGYDHTLLGPAAELNTTALDMAKFMLAHLGASPQGRRLLDPATERLMQARHFSVHPDVSGWCYGFMEMWLHGRRGVGHGGDWRGFESQLVLLPELNVGLFASANAMLDGFSFYNTLGDAFADHYLPAPRPARLVPSPDFAARASRYTGTYVQNRRVRADFMRLGELIQYVTVSADDEGGLTVTSPLGPVFRLVEISPDLFRFADRDERAFWFVEPDGGPEHLVLGSYLTLDRVHGWQSPRLHALLGIAASLLFVGTLAGWALGFLSRRIARAAPSPTPLAARVVGSLVAALFLAALAGIATGLRPERFAELLVELPLSLRATFAAVSLGSLLSLSLPWFAWRGLRPGAHAPLARLHLVLLAAAGLLLAAQAWHWNLLGALFLAP